MPPRAVSVVIRAALICRISSRPRSATGPLGTLYRCGHSYDELVHVRNRMSARPMFSHLLES